MFRLFHADILSYMHVILSSAAGTTKDYKAKMRSLHFNLKDPHNAELRAHVLRGHISPDNFVQMTATELASKVIVLSCSFPSNS